MVARHDDGTGGRHDNGSVGCHSDASSVGRHAGWQREAAVAVGIGAGIDARV